ncbi:MAG: ATP-grasp domain-containing protein [Candidatus Saccharimonadales bacterium]
MLRNLIITYALIEPSTNLETFEHFASAVHECSKDIVVEFCSVQNLLFTITTGTPEIYIEEKKLKDVTDILYLRNVEKYKDYANALRLYADANGIGIINYEDIRLPYYGKVSQGFLYALHHIPTPNLASAVRNETLRGWLSAKPYGYPFILKENNGIKGRGNYLVQDKKQRGELLSQGNNNYVAQPYIENEGELRILTFGRGTDHLIFTKKAVAGLHLNNTSQGGSASQVQKENVEEAIHKAVDLILRLTNRENLGIDVLLGTDGKWYVLEANTTPALYTGVFLDLKAREYARLLTTKRAKMVKHP